MAEYLSPGVYVEEIDAGPKPIEGVSTSTAGAIGVTARGPTSGKPELVTSFAEFQRKFGGIYETPDAALQAKWSLTDDGGRWWNFPLSVQGFFENGGQRLYVKRVFASGADESIAQLHTGLVINLTKDAAKGASFVTLESLIGIQQGQTVSFVHADTGVSDGPFAVVAYDSTTREVTLGAVGGGPFAGLPAALKKGSDFAELAARDATKNTLEFKARDKGAWGDDLYVHVRPIVGATYTMLADASQGPAVSTTTSADAVAADTNVKVATIAGLPIGSRVLIADGEYVVIATPAGPPSITLDRPLGTAAPSGTAVRKLRRANPAGFSTTVAVAAAAAATTIAVVDVTGIPNGSTVLIGGELYVTSNQQVGANTFDVPAPGLKAAAAVAAGVEVRGDKIAVWGGRNVYLDAIVELDDGKRKDRRVVASLAGDVLTLSGVGTDPPGIRNYYEGYKLRVIEAEAIVEYRLDGNVLASEAFTNLRLKDDNTPSYLVNQINLASKLVTVRTLANYSESDLTAFPTATGGDWQKFSGGDDDLANLSVDDFVGKDGGGGKRTGIAALEDIDEISICMAPNMWSTTVQSALITHCEELKYRFAIIDPRNGLDIEEIRAAREPIDTKYAALYYPWLHVRNPLEKRVIAVAPSAHVAGIYARVDVERGVHKAPANEVVRAIDLKNGLETNVTKREQDMLNPKGIDVIRYFPDRGYRVWGARTLSSDGSWKYVNVRRLFIMIEASIDRGTQWAVFEPNDRPLWARVRQTIVNFLTTQWRNGALQGKTADEAFFVRCDESTMTQDDIDNGRLICVIGIAPVKPAEFVIFRIQQKTLELKS